MCSSDLIPHHITSSKNTQLHSFFILRSSSSRSKVEKVYNELPVSKWARHTFINGGHQSKTTTYHSINSPINTEARELRFHRGNENMLIYHSNKTAGFPYEHFPYFGKRIKKLRHYMDSRKPKTLLDLARLKEPSGSILISTVARYDGTTGQIKSHACMLLYYNYQG